MISLKDNTKAEQLKIEAKLQKIYDEAKSYRESGEDDSQPIYKGELLKKIHTKYLYSFLRKYKISPALETHRTWMMFFLLLGLEVMGVEGVRVQDFNEFDKAELVEFISLYWDCKSELPFT